MYAMSENNGIIGNGRGNALKRWDLFSSLHDWEKDMLIPQLHLHSGRTDGNGGHRDWLNREGLGVGVYHYHHGKLAHLHKDGICPYGSDTASVINPYTSRKIYLGEPYYYEDAPYFSLNLVSKALTADDSKGVESFNYDIGGYFYACPDGNSAREGNIGNPITFSFPKNLLGIKNNALFNTDKNELELLCHNKKHDLDDIECYAYVTLAEIGRYMTALDYFTNFAEDKKTKGLWKFKVREFSLAILRPYNGDVFTVGDEVFVNIKTKNAARARLTVSTLGNPSVTWHSQELQNLEESATVEFDKFVVTEEMLANGEDETTSAHLVIKVTANTGGTAIEAYEFSAQNGKEVTVQINPVVEPPEVPPVVPDDIFTKLENDTTLGYDEAEIQTLVHIGRAMLQEQYEPAFIFGMFGNIRSEGKVSGIFEGSVYEKNPEPAYLTHMDAKYNYENEYSMQSITNKSLSTVSAILEELEEGGWTGKFGLGCIQWTGGRTKTLVEIYKEIAGSSDKITFEQVLEAEAIMILRELKNNSDYSDVYADWVDMNNGNLSSPNAVYNAAVAICEDFIIPAVDSSDKRGNDAKVLYEIATNK